MVYIYIFNVRIGKDFGLKNSVFYIRTVLTENNMLLCIFSFTVFIVNEYFTTVTKLRICAHHLLLTIILRERPFNLKGGLWFFSKKIF